LAAIGFADVHPAQKYDSAHLEVTNERSSGIG
jgi:hypothetical protein